MVKHLLSLILILITTIAPAMSAPFQNGSFEEDSALFQGNPADALNNSEQDLTGWTIQITQGNLDWRSDIKQTGAYSIELAGGLNSLAKIYQAFDTVSGAKYEVAFYLYPRLTLGNSENNIKYEVRNQNSSGTLITSSTIAPSTGLNSWTRYALQFTAVSSTTYLSFENIVASGQGSAMDDVTVTRLPVFSKQGSIYPEDPTNQKTKSIPLQDVIFDFSLTNFGIAPDAGSVQWTMSVSPHIAFRIGSLSFWDGQQTLPYVNGVQGYADKPKYTTSGIQAAGVSCCTGLEVQYSSVGENGPWGYNPSQTRMENSNWDGSGSFYSYDDNVRGIKITPSGTWNSGVTTPTSFRINYMGKIK